MSNNEKSKSGVNSEEGPKRFGDEESSEETPETKVDEGNGLDNTEALKSEVAKYKQEFLYLRAEFENYKKNVIKERSDMRKYGSERLIVELLNVLDLLEAALATEAKPENIQTLKKGVELTAGEFRAVLGRFGVEEIAAKGKPFDPAAHEALSSEETNEVPEGHVSQVFKKPYKLYDKVVRHGQVVVAKPKPQ